jgi:hypothetical protein
LIDFGYLPTARAVGCAKFFHRAGAADANSVNTKSNAFEPESLSRERAFREPMWIEKSLFHRAFFNSVAARANFIRTLQARAFASCFCRNIALRSVASRCVHVSLSGNTVFFIAL